MSDPRQEFLAHAEMVRDYAQDEPSLTEASTRTACIHPVLVLLGYRDIVDIREEVAIRDTKEFLDYELRVDGRATVIVEAKPLGHQLTTQDGGQCVQYASVRGVRWCLVTNGKQWEVFDAQAPGPLATKKVAAVSLESDDGTERAWSVLSLFSRESLARAMPLTRLLVDRVVEDDLRRPDSAAVAALRGAVQERFAEDVSASAIVDSVARLQGGGSFVPEAPGRTAPPMPTAPPPPSDIQDLIDAHLLPPDAELECTARGKPHRARLREGKIDIDGQLYSPSAAASVVLGGTPVNGWTMWRYKGERLTDLRAKLRETTRASVVDPSLSPPEQ
jgi:hypothetical protein